MGREVILRWEANEDIFDVVSNEIAEDISAQTVDVFDDASDRNVHVQVHFHREIGRRPNYDEGLKFIKRLTGLEEISNISLHFPDYGLQQLVFDLYRTDFRDLRLFIWFMKLLNKLFGDNFIECQYSFEFRGQKKQSVFKTLSKVGNYKDYFSHFGFYIAIVGEMRASELFMEMHGMYGETLMIQQYLIQKKYKRSNYMIPAKEIAKVKGYITNKVIFGTAAYGGGNFNNDTKYLIDEYVKAGKAEVLDVVPYPLKLKTEPEHLFVVVVFRCIISDVPNFYYPHLVVAVERNTVDFETEIGNFILKTMKEKEMGSKSSYIGEALK